jgi:hypothetical protein
VLIGPVGESDLTHLSLVEPGSRLLEGMASPTVPTDGTNPHKDRVNLLTNRDTPLLNIKETGRYGRHGREQEERDKGSKKV